MTQSPKTVEQLCAEHQIDARQLAERSGVDEQRVIAITLVVGPQAHVIAMPSPRSSA